MRTEMYEDSSLMTEMRQCSWFNRIVGSIVIIAMSGLSIVPAVAAAQQEIEQVIAEAEANEISPEAEMSQTVLSVLAELEKVEAKLAAAEEEESDEVVDTSEEDEALEELTEKLTELDQQVMAGFDEVGVMLEDKELPEVIVERHEQAVAKYQSELAAVLNGVEQIRETTDRKKRLSQTTDLAKRLKSIKHKRSQQHFDPNELPSRSLQPNKDNKPKLTALEFAEAYPMGDYRKLMADVNGGLPTGEDAFTNSDWLSESDEVKLTQAIIDKAAELGNDPVQIYHWVRNNIQWNPNWGAKQTAQLTMELQSGNAMDIASLAIGLLRAANIPARYVHGTVDVPENQFRNWAGGFEDINSAIDYAASGGIPIGPVISGGVITKVRMEHIWVEAAVDFVPSRAAVNVEPDSWIAIDPSFKQFEYLDGLDIIGISSIDTAQLAQDLIDSGTVNSTESWVSGFDPAILQAGQNQAQVAVDAFVASNLPNPFRDDVIGGAQVIVEEFPSLGASLPNLTISNSTEYVSIPHSLQQRISFAFGTNLLGELNDPISFPWAELNNQKITLAFEPATPDDEAVLTGVLPDEEITDINQIPSSIPAYLVHVIPQLRVNGDTAISGIVMTLGEEIDFRFDPEFVGFGVLPNRYSVVAGSFLNVAVTSNGVSPAVLSGVRADIALTKSITESGDDIQIMQLTRDELLGDIFYAATLGYYAQYASLSQLASRNQSGIHHLAAGLGSFGYEPRVNLMFGFPQSINLGGVFANLPMVRVIGLDSPSNTADATFAKRNLNLTAGLISSALEHAIPDQIFNVDQGNPPDSFSSVKALEKASATGQQIFRLTNANMATTLPALNLDVATENEIEQALLTGKEVITHTNPVSVPGYTGAGYIIYDSITGDGAYKISGSVNGGVYSGLLGAIVAALAIFSISVTPVILAALALTSIAAATIVTMDALDCRNDGLLWLQAAIGTTFALIPGGESAAATLRGVFAAWIAGGIIGSFGPRTCNIAG